MNEEIRLLKIDLDKFNRAVRTIDADLIHLQSLYKVSPTTNLGDMILQLILDKATIEKCILDIKLRIDETQENVICEDDINTFYNRYARVVFPKRYQ